MQCTIGAFNLTDETFLGGVALTGLRLRFQRIFDTVVVLAQQNPQLFDRNKRRVTISFTVSRVHASIKDAETYITDHDALIPRTGDIKLITMPNVFSGNQVIALIVNGALLSHELVRQIGKYTEHNYSISGSTSFAPGPPEEPDHLVTEGGDRITTEGGDEIILE